MQMCELIFVQSFEIYNNTNKIPSTHFWPTKPTWTSSQLHTTVKSLIQTKERRVPKYSSGCHDCMHMKTKELGSKETPGVQNSGTED